MAAEASEAPSRGETVEAAQIPAETMHSVAQSSAPVVPSNSQVNNTEVAQSWTQSASRLGGEGLPRKGGSPDSISSKIRGKKILWYHPILDPYTNTCHHHKATTATSRLVRWYGNCSRNLLRGNVCRVSHGRSFFLRVPLLQCCRKWPPSVALRYIARCIVATARPGPQSLAISALQR